jgi:glycosyltransferase involved in cell wall biosynthesis
MVNCSVIICTHNPREAYLNRVLDGLRKQTLSPERWELLLIDNKSAEPVMGRFDLSWHPLGKHLLEEELGLTPARLRGISHSTASLLVFADDDTVLAPDYLEATLAIEKQWPFIGVWGGSSEPEFEKPLPDWVGTERWRLTIADVKEDIWSNCREGFETIPFGAGMCVRKAAALRFADLSRNSKTRKSLGRKGTSLSGYEDMELAHCALDLGFGTGRSSRLRLTHLIPASRLTLDYFVRHAEGDAASFMLFRASRGLPITKPAPATILGKLRWFLHRRLNGVSREHFEIQKAHDRGLNRGYELASEYLKSKASPEGLVSATNSMNLHGHPSS